MPFLLGFNSLVLCRRESNKQMQGRAVSGAASTPLPSPRTLRPVLNHFSARDHPWPCGDGRNQLSTPVSSSLASIFHPLPGSLSCHNSFPPRAFQFHAITLMESLLRSPPCAGCWDTEMNKKESLPSGSLESKGEADT